MPIRKYGTEPAKVDTRAEDNDPETLNAVKKQSQEGSGSGSRKPERDNSEGQSNS